AVIVSEGPSLDFSSILSPESAAAASGAVGPVRSMRDFESEMVLLERELILDALQRSGGRVSGEGGAAERLGMHPKTLYSRIDKLGLRKRYG
ncbi:MAG: helix-turn-helix domain-containing protein, partial [Chlorobium sp.]